MLHPLLSLHKNPNNQLKRCQLLFKLFLVLFLQEPSVLWFLGLAAHFEVFSVQNAGGVDWVTGFGSPDGEIFSCSWGFYLICSQRMWSICTPTNQQIGGIFKENKKLSRKWLPNYSDSSWGLVKQHILISSKPLPKTSYQCLSHREEKPSLLGLPASDGSHCCQPGPTRTLVSSHLNA